MNRATDSDTSFAGESRTPRPAAPPRNDARPSDPGPRRAIWGLVNDGYALVARTPNLTYDEAFELCRVPDIGDPSAYLDHGVAYLRTPTWGHVFARYFTNAERDSAGRASLVYDVVALSDDEFAALGNDPFRALPPLPADRRPERVGELPLPALTARSDEAQAARLTELLASEQTVALHTTLGALLAGDRVLSLDSAVRTETIECLTLLLPPSLRPLLTFQAPTVDVPRHLPRLTVAERAHALLVERAWTAVLPRDVADPQLTEWTAVAARLAALGGADDRLRGAWTAAGGGDLGTAMARVLRMDVLREGVRTGDLRRAALVVARADGDAERGLLVDAMLERCEPEQLARALADVVRGRQRDAWEAVCAISAAVAASRDATPDRFERFFRGALEELRGVPEPGAPHARVMLACAAAALGDLERFLDFADPALPWDGAWQDGCARWVKGTTPVARLFDALAARGATYADTIEGVQVVARAMPSMEPAYHARAAALALGLVRRTLRERAALEPPNRLGALVDGLTHVWSADRHDAALARVMAGAAAAGDECELLGWVTAVLERAQAGALGEGVVRAAATALDAQRRAAPGTELPPLLGRVLLHFAAADAAFVFRPAWLEIARQVDERSHRELFTRALAWTARAYAAGRFTIGAFADACAIAAADGYAIDESMAAILMPQLVAASVRGGAELALLAATVSAVSTPAAAASLTEGMLAGAGDASADPVRLRRLAQALHEVERVRDADRYDEARARLRRALARDGTITAGEERDLRRFLSVEDGSVLQRLASRIAAVVPNGTGRRTADDASASSAAGAESHTPRPRQPAGGDTGRPRVESGEDRP